MAGRPAGRVLVTSADAAAVPSGMRVVPVGPFSLREAISYLNGRLSADPDKRQGAIELARGPGLASRSRWPRPAR